MGKKHPEGLRDFPASQLFADLIDKGPGRSTPLKRVPADQKSVEQSLANLRRLTCFTPPTEADTKPLEPVKIFRGENLPPPTSLVGKTDFLHLVPASKGREPKKIHPAWPADLESFMEIATDKHKRRRALSSDAVHEATLQRRALRIKLGLPEKSPPWKETLQKFHALTEEDKDILRGWGYHPERVRNIYSLTVERMLRDLERFRGSK